MGRRVDGGVGDWGSCVGECQAGRFGNAELLLAPSGADLRNLVHDSFLSTSFSDDKF